MKENWQKEIINFYPPTGFESERYLKLVAFIKKLLEEQREDIRSVKNMLGMMENEVDRKKIENFIDEYLLSEL